MPTLRKPRQIQADIDAIQQRMERIETEVNGLADKEDATTGDLTRSRRLLSAIEGLSAQRAVLETEMEEVAADEDRRRAAVRSKAGVARNTENSDGNRPKYLENGDDGDADLYRTGYAGYRNSAPRRREGDEVITRALQVLDREGGHLSSASGDRVDTLLRAATTEEYEPSYVAQRLILTERPVYRAAFQHYLTAVQLGRPVVLSGEEAQALRSVDDLERQYASRAMSENVSTGGGLAIPSLIDPTIIITSGAADVPLLRVCRIEDVTTNLYKGIASTGMSWSYDTEAAQVSDDSPSVTQPTITVHMARGFLQYSLEVGLDWPQFSREMQRLMTQGYNDLLAQKTIVGSGTGEPWGIFTALDANTNVEVVTTTDGSFGGADVFKVWNALPERFRSRATWVMSVHVESAIRQFAATTGSASAYFTVDLTADGVSRINGRPVIITDYAPTFSAAVPGTTGAANILTVGDFSNYVMANRAGMAVEAVPLIMGANNRPTGERGLFAHARHGLDSVADNAFRLLQNQ